MRIKTLFCLAGALLILIGCRNSRPDSQTIELPITIHEGYGPFFSSLSSAGIGAYHSNNSLESRLNPVGIKPEWIDAQVGELELISWQNDYQAFHNGYLDTATYMRYRNNWPAALDTTLLSTVPIKSRLAFATWTEDDGTAMIVLDANNNLDFSDDKPFSPLTLEELNAMTERREVQEKHLNNAVRISYERLFRGKTITEEALASIVYFGKYNLFMVHYPLHATAKLKGRTIYINSYGGSTLDFGRPAIAVLDGKDTIGQTDLISYEEYIDINGRLYMNRGVNLEKGVLILEKSPLGRDELRSTQTGFYAPEFSGKEFTTGRDISLENLRGKYLYLDFWATGCGPCIKEFPLLKTLYDNDLDHSKIEVVGIICYSGENDSKEIVEQYGVTWPQLFSSKENDIEKLYNVTGYPTTLLLDPEGMVIAKELRTDALKAKLKELGILD